MSTITQTPKVDEWLAQTLKDIDTAETLQTSAMPLPAGEVRTIPLFELHESAWNPRGYYPEASLAELAESMRGTGFWEWNPLMVRPRPEGGYEIGAGHRRYRAAQRAGLEAVPVVVREMSDEQFLDILNFDNTGREDVHPLHEAAGWQNWMERTGHGVLDIAQRIGQSREYVYQRLKYSALTDAAKVAFLDGAITNGHAILIARLQPAGQKAALKYCEPPKYAPEQRKSVRELAGFIQRDIHLDMERACFDLTSADLVPAAGACTVCPKRTANAPELMARDSVQEELDRGNGIDRESLDQCTDPACFEGKVKAHLVQVKAKLAAEGVEPIDVSSSYGKGKKSAPGRDLWDTAKAGAPGVKTAVVTDGYDVGKVIHVKLKSESGVSAAASKAAQERDAAKRKAEAAAELAVRRKILEAVRPKIGVVTRADLEALVMLSARHQADLLCDWHGIKAKPYKAYQALGEALPKRKDIEIYQVAVELTVASEFDQWALGKPAEALLALAKRYKVDAAAIRRECEGAVVADPPVKKKTAAATKRGTSKKPPAAVQKPKKKAAKKLTLAAKKRIAAAQKKRWAESRKKAAAPVEGKA